MFRHGKPRRSGHSDLDLAGLVYAIFSNNDILVKDLWLYKGTDKNDTISLKQLAQRGILIVRTFGDACSICNDYLINKVHKEFPDAHNNERIVFLVSDMPDRIKNSITGKPPLSFTDNGFTIPMDQYHIPYLFYLDDEMKVKSLFIPNMNYPELTTVYFRILKDRFFD